MQNSESGRKLNQAVNSTSRAVGGAISTAKGAFSTWWTSITAAVPASQPQSESAQANNAQNNNNNSSSGHDSDSSDSDGFVGHEDESDSNYSDSDQSQSDNNRNVGKLPDACKDSPVKPSEIVTAEHMLEKSNNIIEIGKEAEILDRQQRIYTV